MQKFKVLVLALEGQLDRRQAAVQMAVGFEKSAAHQDGVAHHVAVLAYVISELNKEPDGAEETL
jgi:hypothetical protein